MKPFQFLQKWDKIRFAVYRKADYTKFNAKLPSFYKCLDFNRLIEDICSKSFKK